MFNKVTPVKSVSSETPDLPNPIPSQASSRRIGKKRLAAIAAIAAIAVISLAFFIPHGAATIPLSVDYTVGEKMIYDSTVTMTIPSYSSETSNVSLPLNSSVNLTSQETIEVIGFDGENYLLNHTSTMTILGKPISFSLTEKMNKTGYSTYLFNLGTTQKEISVLGPTSSSFIAQLLSKPEVKVGDTISVPYPALSSSIQTTGNLTIKINAVEDITVPAGTYKAFRIDMTSNNLQITLSLPVANSTSISPSKLSVNVDINAQVYLEYGTMRQIKSTMQETASYKSSTLNMTIQMTSDMTLKQHFKP
jgi:hypothetical protein